MYGWLCIWILLGGAFYGLRRIYRSRASKKLLQHRSQLLKSLESLPKDPWIAQERSRYLRNRLTALDRILQRERGS